MIEVFIVREVLFGFLHFLWKLWEHVPMKIKMKVTSKVTWRYLCKCNYIIL
jgi:hypothetical protein